MTDSTETMVEFSSRIFKRSCAVFKRQGAIAISLSLNQNHFFSQIYLTNLYYVSFKGWLCETDPE